MTRKTGETEVSVELVLDSVKKSEINSGVPFFDHMLNLFAKHGLFNLEIQAKGDIDIDCHHTEERR